MSSACIVPTVVSSVPSSVSVTFSPLSKIPIVHSEISKSRNLGTSISSMKIVVTPPKSTVYPFATNRTAVADVNKLIQGNTNNLQHIFDQQVVMTKRLIDMESKYEDLLNNFKGEIMRLESKIFVQERVTDALREEVDRLQQYTRRPCVAIHGIAKDRNERYGDLKHKVSNIIESINSTTTMADVDKFHRNGRVRGGKQEVIVRFKSHSAKEAFFKARKEQNDVMIYPSLTKTRLNFLYEARETMKEFSYEHSNMINPPLAIFANVHGDIQIKFSKKTKYGQYVSINSLEELSRILLLSESCEEDQDYDQEPFNVWGYNNNRGFPVEKVRLYEM